MSRVTVNINAFHTFAGTGWEEKLRDGMIVGSARTAALIQRQPADMPSRIRTEYERFMGALRVANRFELPISVVPASGQKVK